MSFSKEDTQKIKGIAIIMMFFHHLFLAPNRYAGKTISFTPFSEHTINTASLSMKLCVAIFVFLSAYGLTISYKRVCDKFTYTPEQLQRLILKRYIKMMSGFFFVFLCLQVYSLAMGFEWYTHVYGTGSLSVLYACIDFLGLAQLFHTPTFIATFWYMTFAQILIFIFPLLLSIYRKFSSSVLVFLGILFSILFPVTIADASKPNTFAFLPVYIVVVCLGIVSADLHFLERIRSWNPINAFPFLGKILKFLCTLFIILVFVYFRYKTRTTALLPIWEALLSLLIIEFCYEFILWIPIIKTILSILGKYSMDMFLIHNFIRIAWYYDFTYSFHHVFLITIVLLGISLVVSVLIELLKALLHYNQLIQKILAKV
ncbi:MAG: acyltransferase [Eubacterium sp.]|nr:acyltransferase [Eubacterium sp.]